MPTRPSNAGDQAAPAQPKHSLTTRGFKLMRQNPRMAHTLLRNEFRQKVGVALDRRFRDGWSGPPVHLNLNLTRRCNLKCGGLESFPALSGSTPRAPRFVLLRRLPPCWGLMPPARKGVDYVGLAAYYLGIGKAGDRGADWGGHRL